MKFFSHLKLPVSRLYSFVFICLFVYSIIRLFLAPSPVLAAVQGTTFFTEQYRGLKDKLETPPATEVNDVRFYKSSFDKTLFSAAYGSLDRNGAVADIGNTIAMLIKRQPVNTGEYLAYMAGKAGFIDQAYAQQRGGFDILGPIQKLWIATRNIAYLITSLTLVVIGFMIMLRKKIDAQTVIGVEQALPKLVVTLLLVTFSYAIAGLVIDMIYWLSFFGIKLLALNGVFAEGDFGNTAIQTFRTKSIFSIGIGELFRIGGNSTGSAETAADAVGNLVEAIFGSGKLSEALGIISQPIAMVIFAVAILFAVFKLFFSLLMAYIQIILLAILGPLQLMLNALPGSEAFSKWFRNLLANAMAFPAAILMLVFAAALMGQTGEHFKIAPCIGFVDNPNADCPGAQGQGVKWIPPLLFGEGAGLGGRVNPVDAVVGLLGIGILLMTPKVVDMVKEAIQAPEFKYGSAIGEAVGAGWKGALRAPSTFLGLRAEEHDRARQLEAESYARGMTKDQVDAQKKLFQKSMGGQRWGRFLGRFTGLGK